MSVIIPAMTPGFERYMVQPTKVSTTIESLNGLQSK